MDHTPRPDPAIAPHGADPADFDPAPGAIAHGPLARLAYTLGGIGLLGATAADSLAVAGRHSGLHLLGSIELVQAMVVLLSISAMLIATLTGNHASVHIVTERLSPHARAQWARVAALMGALAFLVLAAGSAWVAWDLWNGFEQTELLHIRLRWLRVAWITFALVIAFRFLRDSIKQPKGTKP